MTQPTIFPDKSPQIFSVVETPLPQPESPELSEARRKRALKKLPGPMHSPSSPQAIPNESLWTLPPLALHGIAGEIVREIEPKTEAHPAALFSGN